MTARSRHPDAVPGHPEQRETCLRNAFLESGKAPDCPVYDCHGHVGPFFGAHLPEADPDSAVRMMDRAGVRMLIFCHHAALFAPDVGNGANIEAVRKHPDRLRAYLGVNPNYPEHLDKDLASFDDYSDVYVGLKFLASYHKIPLTDDRCRPAWEFVNERSLPVLCHTWGGSPFDGPQHIRECAERYTNAKILMGHSCHDDWDAAVDLANTYPNVYYELTAVLDNRGMLEKFVEASGSERMLFGTDHPWFDFHYYIGAVLGADVTDEDRRNIFYRNAEKVFPIGIG